MAIIFVRFKLFFDRISAIFDHLVKVLKLPEISVIESSKEKLPNIENEVYDEKLLDFSLILAALAVDNGMAGFPKIDVNIWPCSRSICFLYNLKIF